MELSLVANFDDLRRCNDVLTDGTAEIEYRRFLEVQEESRQQWHATMIEAQRLQKELDKCAKERSDLETKLFHARRLLDMEIKARQDAEKERDALEQKLSRVCEYLRTDRDMNDETRNKYAYLDRVPSRKRGFKKFGSQESSEDLNDTGSFLSNLSVTQSEEDFLGVRDPTNIVQPMKRHRPSVHNGSYTEGKSSRSTRKSLGEHRVQKQNNHIDLDASDKIVATTKVYIPQGDGPIEATSTIEAVPNSSQYNNSHFDKIDLIESTYEVPNNKENDFNIPIETPYKRSNRTQSKYQQPTAPPLHEVNTNSKLLLNLQGRQHEFSNKTVLKNESCFSCQKKLRFGATALKCRTCGLLIHQDCKFNMSTVCVPKHLATPMKKGEQGTIADYVPNDAPMVPGLIVHCVHEVETRGLNEKGIYRQCGSSKDIKELKEKFLRGKNIPALGDIDIHVICGCIKDFLRDLREPLIPKNMWTKFANAAQNHDDKQAVCDLYISINQLPQANRDTLAFLMLHLQRVASCGEATKMSIENLALVFGPTIMGYLSNEIDECTFRAESSIQKDVLEKLLNIPTDYWARFITVESDTENEKVSVHSYFGTPGMRPLNATIRNRKFFETPTQNVKKH